MQQLFTPEDGSGMFIRKNRMIFSGLHGVISQKIELLITTAARTLNSTSIVLLNPIDAN
jgi:hypothetical protein